MSKEASDQLRKAMLAAAVPPRFAKPSCKMADFPFGAKLANWLTKGLRVAVEDRKSVVLTTKHDHTVVGGVLTRALVIKQIRARLVPLTMLVECLYDNEFLSELHRLHVVVITDFYLDAYGSGRVPIEAKDSYRAASIISSLQASEVTVVMMMDVAGDRQGVADWWPRVPQFDHTLSGVV
jgi:hypothetical protein